MRISNVETPTEIFSWFSLYIIAVIAGGRMFIHKSPGRDVRGGEGGLNRT